MQEGLKKERKRTEDVSDVSYDAKEREELNTILNKPQISVHSSNKTAI